MTGEIASLKMTISQLESEQIDTLRLALHFRDRFRQVYKENADLAKRFLKISEMSESAEQKLAMAENARIHDLEEIELLKSRFAEDLRNQEIQQRENLNRALNQCDERLETIKATLILAEKKAADSSARALHAESKLEDAMKRLYSLEMENKRLRDEKNRLEEEKKMSLLTANFTSRKALKRLAIIQEQADMDEGAMRESIALLKSQLQDTLLRAEKCQTELELSKEEQIRLLNRVKSLETMSRRAEGDLATASQQHEVEIKEMVTIAQSRESQLTSALKRLTQNHEIEIGRAEEIITQQGQLIAKLREECRSNVETFDIKLSQMEEKHKILLSENKKAKEIFTSVENERNRMHNLSREHLIQVDKLTKKVYSLEEQLSEKKFQMGHQNAKQRDILVDAKLLAQQIRQLRIWITQNIKEKDNELFETDLFGSFEAQEAAKRIESLAL
ncbi:unnamed protein product [Rodentolepis nana]|uniref:Cilia- and flagella-associated protein 157 n=1 Tax=Rodentolepis nana TaxID=102285 RepID=A0A0R3T734_RODNA|nr:unnamed protein product [Rodentolepis nana]